ncbi:MAG: RHS repeat-associated core domain-containing protein [Vicinamibacterales bacterium]
MRPWGAPVQGGSTSGYAFTGRDWDVEIQLYYHRARYYSAEHGRFLSDDPSGLSAGINLLEYVGNSPASRIDPFGLQWFRPPTEKSVFGRDGTWVEPDGAGQVIADNVPAMHTTSKMHDELLTDVMPILVRIGIPYKTADQDDELPHNARDIRAGCDQGNGKVRETGDHPSA